MKRRLFKLVVFLLLGAIVNVAVMWGIAAMVPINVIYYAVILWLLFCGPFVLWRHIRLW